MSYKLKWESVLNGLRLFNWFLDDALKTSIMHAWIESLWEWDEWDDLYNVEFYGSYHCKLHTSGDTGRKIHYP